MLPLKPLYSLIFPLLQMSGANYIARLINQSARIALYHGVSDEIGSGIFNYRKKFISTEAFAQQIRWMKKYYRIMALEELIDASQSNTAPSRALAITFDDGYKNNATDAYPILSKEQVPATFFLTTDFVDRHIPLPVDVLEYAIGTTPHKTITLTIGSQSRTFPLRTYQERVTADMHLRAHMKKMSPKNARDLRQDIIAASEKNLHTDLTHTPYQALSWEQVGVMERNGMTFAAHTCSHPILSTLNQMELDQEIGESTRMVHKHTKKHLRVFAYPNGGHSDFSPNTIETLKKYGYTRALTTIPGTLRPVSDPFIIPRYTLDSTESFTKFKTTVSGLKDTIQTLLLKK